MAPGAKKGLGSPDRMRREDPSYSMAVACGEEFSWTNNQETADSSSLRSSE